MLVLRDRVTGDCYVVGFTAEQLDTERLDFVGLEIAGPVRNHKAVQIINTDDEEDEDQDDQLYFTTCERADCDKWLLIIDDQAPEHCTEHEESEN